MTILLFSLSTWGWINKWSIIASTAIPRDMLPLDMLTLRYAIMNCGKKFPDMLILVIYLTPAMLFFNFVKKISRYANFSDVFTPCYAIVNFSIISESLAVNLKKVRQTSVWQTVLKFWFIWLWDLSFLRYLQ